MRRRPSARVAERGGAAAYSACTAHPGQRAGWRCTACERRLCPACTAERRSPNAGSAIPVCFHCTGLAAPLTRPRRFRHFWEVLPEFFQSFGSTEGLTTLVALGGVLWVLGLIEWLGHLSSGLTAVGWLGAQAILVGYTFSVIQAAARGGTRLPDPTDFMGLWSLLGPLARLVVATVYLWLPGLFYLRLQRGWSDLFERGLVEALTDPAVLILGGLGLLYYPIAVIIAAITSSMLAVLNPVAGLRIIARIPG